MTKVRLEEVIVKITIIEEELPAFITTAAPSIDAKFMQIQGILNEKTIFNNSPFIGDLQNGVSKSSCLWNYHVIKKNVGTKV